MSRGVFGVAGSIEIIAGDIEVRNGSRFTSNTAGFGSTGTIRIEADSLLLTNSEDAVLTLISSQISGSGFGDAGGIEIRAGDIEIRGGSAISSSSLGRGNGGSITIDAGSLFLDNENSILFNGIASEIGDGISGTAGSIDIFADEVEILRGGVISSSSFGFGDSRSISVEADHLLIDKQSTQFFTGIRANSESFGEESGSIVIVVEDVEIFSGGAISSAINGVSGDAGSIRIQASHLLIDGRNGSFFTGLNTNLIGIVFFSEGSAGIIEVIADDVEILNGGEISSSTLAAGNAGSVSIQADSLFIEGVGSRVASTSTDLGRGNAGSVLVIANEVTLTSGASITSSAEFGSGGDVVLDVAGLMRLEDASVTTISGFGEGGRISVSGGAVDLVNSEVSTTVLSNEGNAGDIQWATDTLVLDNSILRANKVFGNGGNMTIDLQQLITHPGRTATIEASSELGLSGDINISTPETEGVGGIMVLSGDFLDTTALLDEPCAARIGGAETSSLVPAGRGGLPVSPDDPGSALYFADQSPGIGLNERVGGVPQPSQRQQVAALWTCSR